MSERLHSLSRVSSGEMDTVAYSRRHEPGRAFEILMEAQQYWDNMSRFRYDRERNKRYNYGDQWTDLVTVEGKTMTEEQYIKEQGSVPLKNNLIRRLARNVLGAYRNQNKVPLCYARDRSEQQFAEATSELLKYNMQSNKMMEMYARTMEEYLISGFCVFHTWFGWRDGKLDCWTDYVQPNNFFIDNNMRDFRGWDVSCLGEVHDIDFTELVHKFAKTPQEYARLSEIYSFARNKSHIVSNCERFGYSRMKSYDFLFPANPERCRVIEVWRKESKPRYRCHDYNSGEVFKIEVGDYAELVERVNADRLRRGTAAGMREDDIPLIEAEWFMDSYWYFYYLTPFGDILKEGESPYEHKGHPYVFKAYPYIDGEIHSFVSDVIDQQRYTNRLITLHDWIMRASAKGVLLVPEESLGTMDINEIADEWSRFNGVIAVKTKNGTPLPQQIATNSTNIGINELLNLQLKFFEDISGVNGALQGKPGYSGTSGALYAQQAQNGSTSLVDLLESFGSFVSDNAYKTLKNILQYYDDKRIDEIVGNSLGIKIDARRIRDVEWDIRIADSTDTPTYRDMANEFLLELWKQGQLGLRQMLEVGNFPFADKLLQTIDSQEAQMAQGGTPEGLSPELQQQVQQGADMGAVNKAYEMMKR